jgi:hypothetical protein
MGLIVALALLLAAVGYGWLQQRLTDSATVLRDLASAVEQHRSKHNGVLPESLARMEAFPKGAVEWPLRYWNARDASGRTEIIWVRQKAHYRIMLRQGSETWTLTDGEPKPKLMMTGKH